MDFWQYKNEPNKYPLHKNAVKQILETATDCEMQNIPTGFQDLDALTKGWSPVSSASLADTRWWGKA